MPAYVVGATLPPTAVCTPSRPSPVWSAEQLSLPEASQQVNFQAADHLPTKYAVEIAFTQSDGVTPANPGNFSLQLQHATTDNPNFYCVYETVTQAILNSFYVGRIEVPACVAKYGRLYMASMGNNVYVTATYCP